MICYPDEATKQAELERAWQAGADAERKACIQWLEWEAGQSGNPAHARALRDIAHDFRNGHHAPVRHT